MKVYNLRMLKKWNNFYTNYDDAMKMKLTNEKIGGMIKA